MMLETIMRETFINTDQMRELRAIWDKERHRFELVCTFTDGSVETYTVRPTEWQRFRSEAEFGPVIKADPGYWLLSYWSEPEEVIRWPVLAWRLDLQHGCHQVITPASSGNINISGEYEEGSAVLCPNGRLMQPGNQSWVNEAEWLEDMRNRAKAKKENAAPAA
jgi:hypothetical protein